MYDFMNKRVEILAPAGSYDSMRAAMNAGCDAVYIGGSSFGARAYADNPDEELLLKAIDEAHIRGKKLYLTVNTLLKEKELAGRLYDYLEKFYRQGLDAVIVQDVGVLNFIHRNFPDLPIHASTQMTLTMAQGANLLKEYGVSRLVTSRELSLKEIRAIRDNTDLEIESFVHGALCYCYSGQCLMSSLIGGRSGNRGRCAQPCRMPYRLYMEEECLTGRQEIYLLSPKDINTLAIIPELVEAGIDSFKIEGRMKGPEYAAVTSYIYRKYLDLYYSLGKEGYASFISGEEFREDMQRLQDVYNRGGFSQGYAKTYHGKDMMSLNRPNHSGVYVGRVRSVKEGYADIVLEERINGQDVLEIRRINEKLHEFTTRESYKPGEQLRIRLPQNNDPVHSRKKDNAAKPATAMKRINAGDEVYRTRNNTLLDYLTENYVKKDAQYPIKGRLVAKVGQKLSLTLSYGACSISECHNIVEEARNAPVTRERIKLQLEKTGTSFFYFDELLIEADDNIFVPLAWINELRRAAIARLEEVITNSYRREGKGNGTEAGTGAKQPVDVNSIADAELTGQQDKAKQGFGIVVSVQSMEQWKEALSYPEITAIYLDYESFEIGDIAFMAEQTSRAGQGLNEGKAFNENSLDVNKGIYSDKSLYEGKSIYERKDLCKGKSIYQGKCLYEGKNLYLMLPHICRQAIYKRLERDLAELVDNDSIKGFVVKNYEEIALLKSLYDGRDSKKEIILNYNMYVYNKEAKSFWRKQGISHFTAAVELNARELKELGIEDSDMPVYGYLPLMVSAQCVFDNTAACMGDKSTGDMGNDEGKRPVGVMTDRLDKRFFVRAYCSSCCNIIYNGQPLALHRQADEICALGPKNIRLDFTIETAGQMRRILDVFVGSYLHGEGCSDAINDYTTGHYKRGVL